MRESRLGTLIELILLTTLPAASAACDAEETASAVDATAERPLTCFDDPRLRSYQDAEITYAICDPASDASPLGDAGGDDGSIDGGSAGDAELDALPDAERCFTSCDQACKVLTEHLGWAPYSCLVDKSVGRSGIATCTTLVPCGRRPAGLRAITRGSGGAVGRWLAESAWLEAASIHAFRRLERELRAHGAPVALIRSTQRAARDERRHARTMARLARRRGGGVPRVVVEETGTRSLEAIAMENAVEACVGETYGALVAAWQARRATDPSIRAAYATIAEDELRHAELGWEVAGWLDGTLDEDARRRVGAAREAAITKLIADARDSDVDGLEELGLPSSVESQTLIRSLFATLG